MVTSARRSDKWWEARYAKSQQRIEQERLSASADEWLMPHVPAVSTLIGPDGAQYMLRLIPPGEPLDHVGRFAVAATLVFLFSRGYFTHSANNPEWIAVVERQRGPWRGYERVEVRTFTHYADAAHFLQTMRRRLESSETH